MSRKVFSISFVTYMSVSLAAALGFLGVAQSIGGYTRAAVYGGAGWVFLLSLIVSMPLTTSYFKRKYAPQPMR